MAMNIKDRSFDMIDIASSDDDLKIKLLMSNNAYLCEIMTLLALQTDYMESLIINIYFIKEVRKIKVPKSYSDFTKMSLEDQYEFIMTKSADMIVVKDLIREKRKYRDVISKLTKQLIDNGLVPCTNIIDEEKTN